MSLELIISTKKINKFNFPPFYLDFNGKHSFKIEYTDENF